MKSKHTPGPWKFCNDTLCQATGNYLHLGTFVDSPGLGHATKANRSLIESAPDLLAALELLYADPHSTKGAKAAAEAIAKATLKESPPNQPVDPHSIMGWDIGYGQGEGCWPAGWFAQALAQNGFRIDDLCFGPFDTWVEAAEHAKKAADTIKQNNSDED